MINAETAMAVDRIATVRGFEAAALKAFIETESAGVIYATVDGRKEPLIRWEGHYFWKLCDQKVRDRAVALKLASSRSQAIPNPSSQQARWDRLLKPAMALDKEAAFESCSWGLGQVMGANWKMLGFSSASSMVDTARSGVEGQIELMVRFLEKSGLKGALVRHDWKTVASGYNGPNYAVNRYDVKMAEAYARYKGKASPTEGSDGVVVRIQQRLVAHGYTVKIDGMRGPATNEAIRQFQRAKGLTVDGIVGRFTMDALNADPASVTSAPQKPVESDQAPGASTAPIPAHPNLWTALAEMLKAIFARRSA